MLDRDIESVSPVEQQSLIGSILKWLNPFKNKSVDPQFFPSWSLEYTAPQTLEHRMIAKVGKKEPRNAKLIRDLADSVSAIKEVLRERDFTSVWDYVQEQGWLKKPEESQTQSENVDNDDIRYEFQNAESRLRAYLDGIHVVLTRNRLGVLIDYLEKTDDGGAAAVDQLKKTGRIEGIPFYKREASEDTDIVDILRICHYLAQREDLKKLPTDRFCTKIKFPFINDFLATLDDNRYIFLRLGLFFEGCGEPEAADYCYNALRRYGGLCLRGAKDREKFEKSGSCHC